MNIVKGKDTAEIMKITLLNYRQDGIVPEEKLYHVGKTRWIEIKNNTENEVGS
jgi:hypothetical protein